FLAVPIAGPNGPLGALVLQPRGPPAFEASDIELASALTAPIAALADRARLVDELHGASRASTRGARRITLSCPTPVPGSALRLLRVLPRPDSRGAVTDQEKPKDAAGRLDAAMVQANRALEAAEKEAQKSGVGERKYFQMLRTILEDARLRERALELSETR